MSEIETDINYVTGDATRPQGDGNKFIVHCVNDIGQWGSGFVVAVSNRWPSPEALYRKWYEHREEGETGKPYTYPFRLGEVQYCRVEKDIWVCNLIGQHRNIWVGEKKPVRYDALREGFAKIRMKAFERWASIHMPRIGADRARGDWSVIEKIIQEELCTYGLSVTVYDLPK